jgi:hypothetical protein
MTQVNLQKLYFHSFLCGATTLSIRTLRVTTLSRKGLFVTLCINDNQNKDNRHYQTCHYAECRVLFIVMLCVIMLNAVMLSALMLSDVAPLIPSLRIPKNSGIPVRKLQQLRGLV